MPYAEYLESLVQLGVSGLFIIYLIWQAKRQDKKLDDQQLMYETKLSAIVLMYEDKTTKMNTDHDEDRDQLVGLITDLTKSYNLSSVESTKAYTMVSEVLKDMKQVMSGWTKHS